MSKPDKAPDRLLDTLVLTVYEGVKISGVFTQRPVDSGTAYLLLDEGSPELSSIIKSDGTDTKAKFKFRRKNNKDHICIIRVEAKSQDGETLELCREVQLPKKTAATAWEVEMTLA